MIEDLLPAAFNAAQAKASKCTPKRCKDSPSGLPMGGFADILSQLPGANPTPTSYKAESSRSISRTAATTR